ncbi:discoidin/SUN/FTP domain-containing protein [Mycoplasmopsis edwardii]|nr:hypothetical protein [Mycoplasmopsis edwardii]
MKIKRLLNLALCSGIIIPTLVVSCSSNKVEIQTEEKEKQRPKTEARYSENKNFTNKLNQNQKSQKNKFTPENMNTIDDYLPIAQVFKVWVNSEFKISNLPKKIRLINSELKEKWVNVSWGVSTDITIDQNKTILGTYTYKGREQTVDAVIIAQNRGSFSSNQLFSKIEGLSVDKDKSSKDGSDDGLDKLIDRSGDYINTGSRWDNWHAYNKQQDTKLVFKWEETTSISRVEIHFWRYADKGDSLGVMPKNIYIKYSSDGINWKSVENQDKITSQDFGPMQPYKSSHQGVSDAKIINFDAVKTKWIKISWDPAQDAQNRNLIIGITHVNFKGPESTDKLHINQINSIDNIWYKGKTLFLAEGDNEFVVEDLNATYKFNSKSSYIQTNILEQNSEHIKYRFTSYNDLGNFKIYNVTFKLR